VLRLDEIRDADVLRQIAILLERENAKLHAKLQTLTAELARLHGEARPSAELELDFLKELLAQRERALFGPSSERRPRPTDPEPAPAPPPRRGHGPRIQPELPRLDIVHALDAADQICPQCGGTLTEMPGQTEDSEEIDVVEKTARLPPSAIGARIPPFVLPLLSGGCRAIRRRVVRQSKAFAVASQAGDRDAREGSACLSVARTPHHITPMDDEF
jgi:hypothetical protein